MLDYNASLKQAIDEINKGLGMLQNLTWTSNSITRMPEEMTQEWIASDPEYLVNKIYDIPESGKYRLDIVGNGKSAYTVKSPATGKVVYTEKNIDDSYTTSDLILGKGDQLYINASPDNGKFVRIQLIRQCTLLELFQELHDSFIITKRDLEGKIANIPVITNSVLEGWFSEGDTPTKFYEKDDTEKLNPVTPSEGKIYINLVNNVPYRWNGSYYDVVGGKYLSLGETSFTAFAGNRGVALEKAVATKSEQKNLLKQTLVPTSKLGTLNIGASNWIQGGTVYGNYIYYYDWNSSSVTKCKLKKANLSTLEVVSEYVYESGDINHNNDMFVYKDYLCIIEHAPNYKLSFWNQDLTFVKRVSMPINCVGCKYNSVTNQFIMWQASTYNIYTYSYDFNNDTWYFLDMFTCNEMSGQKQNMAIDNDYVYLLTNSANYDNNVIWRYTYHGILADVWVLDFNSKVWRDEAEFIACIEDTMYCGYGNGDLFEFSIPQKTIGGSSNVTLYEEHGLEKFRFAKSNYDRHTSVYVSETGDDSNGDGSKVNPFRTIQKAIFQCKPCAPSKNGPYLNTIYVLDSGIYPGFTTPSGISVIIQTESDSLNPTINNKVEVPHNSCLRFNGNFNFIAQNNSRAIFVNNGGTVVFGNYTYNVSSTDESDATSAVISVESGGTLATLGATEFIANLPYRLFLQATRSATLTLFKVSGLCKTLMNLEGGHIDIQTIDVTYTNFMTKSTTKHFQSGLCIQKGMTDAITLTPKNITTYEVMFEHPFAGIPNVVASFWSGTTNLEYSNLQLCVFNITKTGFTLRIINNSEASSLSPNVQWIAVN